MEFSICIFPDDDFHTSEYLVQDVGVFKLDVVSHVYAVLSDVDNKAP